MSWRYILLGSPQDLEEIMEELKFRGIKKVNIKMDAVVEGSDTGSSFRFFKKERFGYYVVLSLSAEGFLKELKEFPEDKFELGKIEAEKVALERAVEIAQKLTGLGFEVTINNKLASNAEVALVRYEEICRRYSQARGKIF